MKSIRSDKTLLGAATFIVGMCAALGGCTLGPKYKRPDLPAPPPITYKENTPGSAEAQASGWKRATPQDALLRGKWWEVFGDPELNSLEESLIINNQNIKQSFENYMAARAVVRGARATLFPTVAFSPGATAQGRGSGQGGLNSSITGSSSSRSYELPFGVSWEPDLFGSIRNTIREQANNAQVSSANLANVTLSEQSSLAQYYFQLRGQDALQELYNNTIAAYRESLRITQVLFKTGIDSDQDVAQAETALRTAEANAVAVGTARAQYEHAVALLVGKSASEFSLPVRPLQMAVPNVPTGVPSQLLERRPDISAAERTMAAGNALIGVGKSAYYPTVSLSASGGTETSAIADLLTKAGTFWSAGGTAAETLLDFGARRARVQQFQAQYNADVASYRETVLNAFREVEDYLVASRQLAEQVEREQTAVAAAQHYEALATTRYKLGIDTYLNVLVAQNSLLNAEQSLTNLKTSQMTSAVQLIAALGGGWDTSQIPGEREMARKP